ncbi:MAG: acetylornithine carbamoyltransferase [Chitinophagaceae bacterium]
MKNFISVADVENINELVQEALAFKANPFLKQHVGSNKRLGLLFLNPSLRTRLSTQIAAENLGLKVIVLNVDKESWKMEFDDEAIMQGTSVEHIKDAAPILGNYFDILGVRSFPGLINKEEDYSEHIINQFIKYAQVPIVSLESATLHPLQSFTDIITITETVKQQQITNPKIVLTWAPHIKPIPQCVANSFAEWINKWDCSNFVIAQPKGFELNKKFTQNATVTNNQFEALENADFVYVKNWSSYNDYGKVYNDGIDWMLDENKLKCTNNAKIMHCLPVRRNVELSSNLLDSSNSLVTKQASNRVWAAQAVLSNILQNL